MSFLVLFRFLTAPQFLPEFFGKDHFKQDRFIIPSKFYLRKIYFLHRIFIINTWIICYIIIFKEKNLFTFSLFLGQVENV